MTSRLKQSTGTMKHELQTGSTHQHIRQCNLTNYTDTTVHTSKLHSPPANEPLMVGAGLSSVPEANPGGGRGGDPVRGGRAAVANPAPASTAPAGASAPGRGVRRLAEEIGDALDDVHRLRSGASSSSASPPRGQRRGRREAVMLRGSIRIQPNPIPR